MRIAIDARMYQESGIGRYTRNLVSNLQKLDKKNEYLILHLKHDYDTLGYHGNFRKILADFKWYGVSEQIRLPRLLKNLKVDLVHFPHFNVPIFYNGEFVVTIHDLIHQHFSMQRATTHGSTIYKIKKFGYGKVFLQAINKSEKILVPSNFVKNQLATKWGIHGNKVVVTHEAVDDIIDAVASELKQIETDRILSRLKVRKPYLFYVGNAHPHKNVEGLIKAFLNLRKKYSKLNLVLSGYDHYFWKRIRMENRMSGIIYTGYVNDEQLIALYKNAEMFVMPSFEEGFGIPLLEAFACGCPVASSNAGALKEVGGEAAIYFDPGNVGDMGNKIDRVLGDEKLREDLIEKGKKRVKLFSWKELAEQTLEVYE